jgi:hypothetical protein
VDDATLNVFSDAENHQIILDWIEKNTDHDVTVCDCCGNGEKWYCAPGDHNPYDNGHDGPYAYNGGLPECY